MTQSEHSNTLEKATAPAPGPKATPPQPRWRLQTFRSLRHRDFRYLWFSILGTSSGQWMEQIAVAWLVLDLTDSPTMVGLVFGARSLPSLFLSPLGGVIADRADRRMVLVVSQTFAALLAGVMAVLSLTGVLELWHIFALISGFGMMWSINNPARHALIPQLVPREDLMNAIALNATGFNVSRSIGPFIGAIFLATIGFGGTFVVASALYASVLFITLSIRTRRPPVALAKASVVEDLRAGVRYVRAHKDILTLIVLAMFPIVIGMPYMALMPVFARDVLGQSEFGFGLMMACAGMGSLAGTITLASLTNLRRGGLALLTTGLVFGIAIFAFGLSKNYILSLVILVFVGGASMMYLSVSNILIQLRVDDAMRGRVMSILMMEFGLMPLGAMAAGGLAELTSPGAVVMTMGLILAAAAVTAMVLLPHIRNMSISAAGTAGREPPGDTAEPVRPPRGPASC